MIEYVFQYAVMHISKNKSVYAEREGNIKKLKSNDKLRKVFLPYIKHGLSQ